MKFYALGGVGLNLASTPAGRPVGRAILSQIAKTHSSFDRFRFTGKKQYLRRQLFQGRRRNHAFHVTGGTVYV